MRAELFPKIEVVTVALDVDPTFAYPFIDIAEPEHPSLIDSCHVLDELLGFWNVPMAVWIDEDGVLVRPPEGASVEDSPLRTMDLSGFPDGIRQVMEEVQKIPGDPVAYRAAIVDWADNGAESRYVLTPDEVVHRSQPRPMDHARAAACFELGQELWQRGSKDAAVPWWREAHRLHPENWTYKRQAWTFVTTEPGQPPDLLQPPNEVYEGSWFADVVRLGGGEKYVNAPDLSC